MYIMHNILYYLHLFKKMPPFLPWNRLMSFSPPLLVPSLLPSPLIPAAMSSGSALSHLINRNLCYNDLSMRLWLYAYAMRARDPVALVADFKMFIAHSTTLPLSAASYWTAQSRDPPGRTHTHWPNITQEAAFLLCAVFPSPLIICCLFCQDDFSRLLILMQAIYLIK